jgi:hypothetical protein
MPSKKIAAVVVEESAGQVSTPLPAPAGLTAFAPFDLFGVHYEPGDPFVLLPGWTVDDAHTASTGQLTFFQPYEYETIENKNRVKVKETRRVLLPVR